MGDETVVIQTKLGQLRGARKQTTLSNQQYFAFLGIPFAKPPVGELRFKAPVPFGGWDGVRDALKDGHIPKQSQMMPLPGEDPNASQGDEDCLVLNVFINEIPGSSRSKKPVMVSIHGGGFAGGSGTSMFAGPDYLIEQEIVLVTFSYRCGAFGFLSLENEEVPGNAGLKDQTLALEWVRDNIDSFGGDRDNVTIFGISAGGASVHYHLLSPLSTGLFHKAIIQSGYASSPLAVQSSPRANAFRLAHAMGCNSVNPAIVLKFLQSVTSDQIVETTKRISKSQDFFHALGLMFTPCVEVENPNRFLPESPNSLLKRGEYNRVPVILGNCLREGSVISFFDGVNEKVISDLNKNHGLLVPSHYVPLDSESLEKKRAAEDIWQYYMNGESLTWDNVGSYVKYQSDLLFNIGMVQTRDLLLKTSKLPIYTYIFSNHSRCFCTFMAKLNPNSDQAEKLISEETCHGADCMYLYTTTIFPSSPLTTEQAVGVKKHCKAWANFALTGNPNTKEMGATWEPDSDSCPTYMDIGESWVSKKGVPFLDRFQFWSKLMSTYAPSSISK